MNQPSSKEVPDLRSAVGRAVGNLQRTSLDLDLPAARSQLARLRGAVDEPPGRSPEVWSMVLDAVPDEFMGTGDHATDSETATHQALTLYAVHQRGNNRPMHVAGPGSNSFGGAAGRLAKGRTASVKARYDALLMATSDEGRAQHLRSLVGLLSTDAIPLDYGQFALDLSRLKKAAYRDSVQRRWGRDFYRAFAPSISDDDAD
ncbi:type I-E CRISPR-associated protein Cse2/CasB [Kocuria sp.]|uniref:type I-E CRISPR-associated protein Cse2/CasB n=1 Tax=Kocuria sp. TaxID=1871328 RepID=UPI0026DF47D0|nr:type I-E CRISPR-associated protein Cse2/CasB [Kocuria sp.]MDO5617955.1 type I-E CRISPR-associated protein Cse2/CasB [Kocuria sp.]